MDKQVRILLKKNKLNLFNYRDIKLEPLILLLDLNIDYYLYLLDFYWLIKNYLKSLNLFLDEVFYFFEFFFITDFYKKSNIEKKFKLNEKYFFYGKNIIVLKLDIEKMLFNSKKLLKNFCLFLFHLFNYFLFFLKFINLNLNFINNFNKLFFVIKLELVNFLTILNKDFFNQNQKIIFLLYTNFSNYLNKNLLSYDSLIKKNNLYFNNKFIYVLSYNNLNLVLKISKDKFYIVDCFFILFFYYSKNLKLKKIYDEFKFNLKFKDIFILNNNLISLFTFFYSFLFKIFLDFSYNQESQLLIKYFEKGEYKTVMYKFFRIFNHSEVDFQYILMGWLLDIFDYFNPANKNKLF